MKEQYVKLFSFLIGFTLIVSGIIYTFAKTYKDDKEDKYKADSVIADEIGNVYKTFYEKEEKLSKYSSEVNKEIINYVSYYSEMPEKYDEVINKLDDYQKYVHEVEDISSYLKETCKEKYSVAEANEKCNAYYINLERTINTYVSNVNFFNTKIDEYNDWIKKENESIGSTITYDTLNKFNSQYTEFVDLNEDGTLLGMENN